MASATGSVMRIGLIAGTLDITENLVFNAFRHITPVQIFQYIASGADGAWAFRAGMESVALAWRSITRLRCSGLRSFTRRAGGGGFDSATGASGLVYGAMVYVIMNFVVLPLTRVPHARAAVTLASRVSGVLALLFCIGATIAVLTRRDRMREIAS